MSSALIQSVTENRLPKSADEIEINSIEGGFMVYQAEKNRVHYLNHTAVLILELCSGRNSIAKIAEAVQKIYALPEAPTEEVREMINRMADEALLKFIS